MNIVFFGGSSATDDYYNEIYSNLKEIFKGIKNCNIITGGTTGVMEAVNKAAKEEGLHTTGIVLNKWKSYVNEYNDEVFYFENEIDRLSCMLKKGDMFICLDGDLGTLAEVFPTWVYCADVDKKIYIVGEKLTKMISEMHEKGYISYKMEEYITYCTLDELQSIITKI